MAVIPGCYMKKGELLLRHFCQRISHLRGLFLGLIACYVISATYALCEEVARDPASLSPDDDVIVVPVVVETPFIDKIVKNQNGTLKDQVQRMKYTMNLWQEQNEFIINWSLQNTGYIQPTEEEKERFFRRQFFRYVTKEGARPYQNDVRNWWDTVNESQTEVDAVANEDIFEQLTLNEGKEPEKIIKVSSRYRFRFRPYLHKARVDLQNPYIDARLDMGFNGRVEARLEKDYSTGTRLAFNYQFTNELWIAFAEQRLYQNISMRVSSINDPENEDINLRNNHTLQFLYGRSFKSRLPDTLDS
jgi:hypothetical protein